METFSLRISAVESSALAVLMERSGLSKAEVARQAIIAAANGKSAADIEDKIDTISSCLADLVRIISAQFEIASNAENRIMRYAAQSAIFGGYLTAEAGVKDAAMASFASWEKKEEGRIK